MSGLLPNIDPDGLLEFSVVYTDRALNHMSKRFVGVMQDILSTLKTVYSAHTAVLVPGSGTFGMEAVARQFAESRKSADRAQRLVQLPLEPDFRRRCARRWRDRLPGSQAGRRRAGTVGALPR